MTRNRSINRVVTCVAALSAMVVLVTVAVTTTASGAPTPTARATARSGPVARWANRAIEKRPVVHRAPAATVSAPVRTMTRVRSNVAAASPTPTPAGPAPTVFEGISNNSTVSPPDPTGDVSETQYVQAVNSLKGARIAVYDKTNGNLVAGPFLLDKLWRGGRCGNHGEGDPVVQFDPLAQRWVLSQFAFKFDDFGNPVGPYSECIAVSTSSDAAGTYYPYGYLISNTAFPDFPKFGVWPDGYYMSIHLYGVSGSTKQGIIAFDRESMLTGAPARQLIFFVNSGLFGLLPSDLEGTTPPPAGAPNYLVVLRDNNVGAPADKIFLYAFFANWNRPKHSHIDGAAQFATQPFNSNLCHGGFFCLPQKGTGMKLDAIGGTPGVGSYLMYPLVYRNYGDHEALAFQHTVKVGTTRHAGINWFEVRDPSTTPTLFQQGTYAPDSLDRWVGSIAMDGFGGIAMAFSTTSADSYPSIAYTGRIQSDTINQMPLGDQPIVAGGGSQTFSPRWGDYTALSVDPLDDCTFWYTDEFYPSSSHYGWHTAIASFRLPTCSGAPGSPSPRPSASPTPTPAQSPTPSPSATP
ncbi:MAG: hypothetical protein QOC87_399 [Actinomycetota bacterium]|nr:hypothetical protein [Actinomycetota bacterium]